MRNKRLFEILFFFWKCHYFSPVSPFCALKLDDRQTKLGMNGMGGLETASSLLLLISHNRQQQNGGSAKLPGEAMLAPRTLES
jgi:hypothetical protein